MVWRKLAATAGIGLAALTAGSATAAPATGHMLISSAWSRPTPKGLPTGVAYMTLTNPDGAVDRLMGASTPVAQSMTLHRSSMKGGVMSMEAIEGGLPIPAGGHVALAPNGYHFMLTGLKQGLSPGATFPATLTFARAGQVKIQITVRATAPAPSMAGMNMH